MKIHILKEEKDMKVLKIENNKGFYLIDGKEWKSVDGITKQDLLELINLSLKDDFERDEFDADLLKNPAHQIIYKHVCEKLEDLNMRRKEFHDEITSSYQDALQKYS